MGANDARVSRRERRSNNDQRQAVACREVLEGLEEDIRLLSRSEVRARLIEVTAASERLSEKIEWMRRQPAPYEDSLKRHISARDRIDKRAANLREYLLVLRAPMRDLLDGERAVLALCSVADLANMPDVTRAFIGRTIVEVPRDERVAWNAEEIAHGRPPALTPEQVERVIAESTEKERTHGTASAAVEGQSLAGPAGQGDARSRARSGLR